MRLVDVEIGEFKLKGVETPNGWSDRAVGIAARTYFTADERSIYDMVDRVALAITVKGEELGHFAGDDGRAFNKDLKDILITQRAAFNTPVWVNVGVQDSPQCWACLILNVEDDMRSIESGWLTESWTFQHGSGCGVNASKIRASGEPLSGGTGTGSGPISLWMETTDAVANVVRSGGRSRRAAKMVILDIDHPDIERFIQLKARAEGVSRLLLENGYDIGMTGKDSAFLAFQNANNSVRVTDAFMLAVLEDREWKVKGRISSDFDKTYQAKELWQQIIEAAHECGDPGIQFHDTINAWHSAPSFGEIRGSNPCSEYHWVDDTVCNLASINLVKYQEEDGRLDSKQLSEDVEILVTAMDILVDLSSYPNSKIADTSKQFRNLGLGFTNLGALLMRQAIPYDSDRGRTLAANIMATIQAYAVRTSQTLAERLGPYPAYVANTVAQDRVLRRHAQAAEKLAASSLGAREWLKVDTSLPLRNAQLSVVAPTGTISFLMDCETTGIEPVIALDAVKELAHGGRLDVGAQQCVQAAIRNMRHLGGESDPTDPYAELTNEELMHRYPEIFETALGSNTVSPQAHVLMMAAVQPFVSGGISKTVNMPAEATVEEVARIYMLAWETKCKAIAIYRDGSKAFQPVTTKKDTVDVTEEYRVLPLSSVDSVGSPVIESGGRRRPEGTRISLTHKFSVGGEEFYVTVGVYPDGEPCEMFIHSSKHGSIVGGWADVFSIAVSLGLQYGVPMETYVDKFKGMSFLPQGLVQSDSESIKFADSPVDYIFKWIERTMAKDIFEGAVEGNLKTREVEARGPLTGDTCASCGGSKMQRAGTCLVCQDCGEPTGCS